VGQAPSSVNDSAYLQGMFGDPYNVPLLGGMDFWDTIAPNSSFIFPAGQAISRTTYSAAFACWGTTYGAGDGSTTFNVPDKTGRVFALIEATATRPTSTYFGGNSTALGAVGDLESHTRTIAEIAAHTHNTLNDPTHTHSGATGGSTFNTPASSGATALQRGGGIGASSAGVTITNQSQGGGAHNNVQPTIVCS
jgi:microcystin-dependent protein